MRLEELGIVGCGGAGFPTHIKLTAKNVEHLIVNAAECEPLLHKDKEILIHHTSDFFRGLAEAMRFTSAQFAHIGIKAKHKKLVSALEASITEPRIRVLPLGDFYPAGDEYELVYEASKRLIPFGGIPLNVGCMVVNVETLLHLGRERPVTTSFLTVCGDVPCPITVELPVGISVREAISLSGRDDMSGLKVIDGGPMMGRLLENLENEVVTKTCGGLIVLPETHPLIVRLSRPMEKRRKIAKSACDQCTDCTELCPRALLGYPIRPHKAMRAAQMTGSNRPLKSVDAVFCCECGLCSLIACPEDLPPREMCQVAKQHHLAEGFKPSEWPGRPEVHPMRSARRVSVDRLVKKLGLSRYYADAPLSPIQLRVEKVRLPMKMHIGVAAEPIVKSGASVKAGDLIARPPANKLGAFIHASISGTVSAATSDSVTIRAC